MNYIKSFFLCTLLVSMCFASNAYTKNIPSDNKKAVKELNDLLVDYFKKNCKGKYDTSTCPILSELTPTGNFNSTIAKDYVKNYHFFIFNDQWIWVGHGLFKKIIGGNHKDFQGGDGKFFAQGFRTFVDKNEKGYYPYVEAKVFGSFKNVAYLHRLVFKDGTQLVFGTCYNTPINLIDKNVLNDLKSQN
jgi:hypothetical protein